jgi:hypothetical protein
VGADSTRQLAFAARDGAQLSVSLGSTPQGTVRLRDGSTHAFHLSAASAPVLYRAQGGAPQERALVRAMGRSVCGRGPMLRHARGQSVLAESYASTVR